MSNSSHVSLPVVPSGILRGHAFKCLDVLHRGETPANRPSIERMHHDGLIESVPERPRPGRNWVPRLTEKGRVVARQYEALLAREKAARERRRRAQF